MTSQRPADPQRLNLYAYTRNNPLLHTDPNGLDIIVTGSEAEKYRKDLERATKLKLAIDKKTGQVTIKGEPKQLSKEAQQIKAILNDKDNTVQIEASKNRTDVLVGQFQGGGKQALDYTDIGKFGKGKGGSTPQSIVIHETTEAYEGLVNPSGGFANAHKGAIDYENSYRSGQGLGERIERNQTMTTSGNDITITIDFTTHREKVTIDRTNPGQIKSVKVEKKNP